MDSDVRRLAPRDAALLALLALPLCAGLGTLSAWYAEQRWFFIARHMLESGDWLSMERDGAFYGDKPYLTYWLQALSASAHGGFDEAAARLPSALAGLGTVLLTAALAARLLGRSAAFLAGVVLLTGFSFVQFSRLATAEMANLFFCTLSIALWLRVREKPTIAALAALGLSLGLGGQAKGIPAVAIPGAVAAADLAWLAWARRAERPWRSLAWRKWIPGGALALLLATAAYLGPFVLARLRSGNWEVLELMWRENFVRAFDAFDHREGGPLFYTYVLPGLMAPWSLFVPAAVAFGFARARAHDGYRFLAFSFAAAFLLITSSESRRSYYILPAVPWAAILVAGFLEEALRRGAAVAKGWRLLAWAPIPLFLLVALAASIFLVFGRFVRVAEAGALVGAVPGSLALGLALAPCAAALGVSLLRRSGDLARFGVVLTALVGFAYLVTGAEDIRSRGIVDRAFAARVRAAHPKEAIHYYRIVRGSPERYYFGEGPLAENADALRGQLLAEAPEAPQGALVLCEPRFFPDLASRSDLRLEVLDRAVSPAIGSGRWGTPKERLLLVRVRAAP